MPEWLNGPLSKSGICESESRVRIPPLPHENKEPDALAFGSLFSGIWRDEKDGGGLRFLRSKNCRRVGVAGRRSRTCDRIPPLPHENNGEKFSVLLFFYVNIILCTLAV